jgi:hypothetical protein
MSYLANTNNQLTTVFLNSKLAQKSGTSYRFELETAVTAPLSQRLILSVMEFSCPNAFPVFNSTNNLFVWGLNLPAPPGSLIQLFEITIPDTIMNPVDFCSYVNNYYIVNKNGGAAAYTWTASYNKQTFKIEFASNASFQIRLQSTCYEVIGITYDLLPIFAGTSPAFTLICPYPVNFVPTSAIFIKTQEFTLQNINSFGYITNTMSRVPVNVNPGYKIFYRPVELTRFLLPVRKIKELHITLENDSGVALDLGTQIFQLLLKIEYIFPQDETVAYDKGSIGYYIKNDYRVPDEEEDEDEPLGI